MRPRNRIGFGAGSVAIGSVMFVLALGAATSGCDHVHWLGILDAGGGSTSDGRPPPFDTGPSVPDAVPFEAGADAGGGVAGCSGACAAIMGCGLGGYGPYRAGIGYAYPYVIGPYGYATGYANIGNYGYGAYGFRDLEYQQCVSACETYSDCVGCGPASERDRIVSCVLANTCPALLDCLAR